MSLVGVVMSSALIFPEATLAEAHEVMERIRRRVETSFLSSYGLTISAGIILIEPGQNIKDLLIKADQALYKAKSQKNAIITVVS